MGRLINADDLLKKFDDAGIQITFNLPVEEILGEDVDIDDFAMLVQDAIQAYKNMVIGTIKDMPTAYSVEKVVEQIEGLAEGVCCAALVSELKNTIDIVRNGGAE